MNTKAAGRSTGTFLLWLSFLLTIGSVVLAVATAQVSYGVTHQRGSTCNGMIPMATSAFALGWVAVTVALIATFAVIVGRRLRDRAPLSRMLYDTSLALAGVGAAVALIAVPLVGITAGALLLVGTGAIFIICVALVAVRRQSHRAHSATPEMQHSSGGHFLPIALLMTAVVALLFGSYVLSTVYDDAPTKPHVCSG